MSTFAATPPHTVGNDLLECILHAPVSLLALEGVSADAAIEQIRDLVRHSGQAVYLWQPDLGLQNLREAHSGMPGSQRLGAALRFVQQSMHFGIYLFRDLPNLVALPDLNLLRQIARGPAGPVRRTVLLEASPLLLDSLGDAVWRIEASSRVLRRPRLRDGRWLL